MEQTEIIELEPHHKLSVNIALRSSVERKKKKQKKKTNMKKKNMKKTNKKMEKKEKINMNK